MDGAVAHIGIGSESLWTWYVGSLEGPGGRTPRRTSSRRLYRALRAGTHTSSVSPDRARHGALSRRRRTYIQVYPLHYSPRFLECPAPKTAVTLFRAMDRVRAHIGIDSESLWTWYMGSMEGPGGRTPRAPSPRRLYRVVSGGTHSSSWRPFWEPLSRRRRTYIRVYPLPLQSPILEAYAVHDRADALRSDG